VKLFGTDNRHGVHKARRELGYTPRVPLEDGIRRTAAWYRSPSRPSASPQLVLAR
jgi:nucleoside-diphosphate-sugar epimerase